ncbi:S-layer homology domain-containing protein [Lysinibacillus sp. NPDC097287]|uniref:S-layer homology domain-containing protein n=1 Tax=Lysinibacillus sp. NPDC097287 TaxID=3364144 RepID=UPI00380F85C2
MKNTRKIVAFLMIFILTVNINVMVPSASKINPLPFEDAQLGRNSNAYLSIYSNLSTQMKESFINKISIPAMEAKEKWGIPASVIIGMAALESGYGTTRIAVHANNFFGIKVWGYNPKNAWQLKGQPDEDYEPVPVLVDYGDDRKIFDESKRRDNWYRKFNSYKGAVDYLAGNLLLNQRYSFAKSNYQERIKQGWSLEKAAKEYLYDIAEAGYNHLGGEYYRNKVGKVIDEWNLTQYDDKKFRDIIGHWAEKEILFLAEKGWISGYPDGTFKPNKQVTRAQAAKIISNFLGLTPTNEKISFSDVHQNHWARDVVNLVAQHKIMNGVGDGRFDPEANVTRAQMAQIMYNAGLYSHPNNNQVNSFIDVGPNHWAYEAIETMKQEGILNGYSDGRFGPYNSTSRAQLTVMIYRLYERGFSN